jgi:hypothetical protein
MRPVLTVIDSPRFNFPSRVVGGHDHLLVQTLVSETPVDTLNQRVLHGFAGANAVQLDAMFIGLGIQRL